MQGGLQTHLSSKSLSWRGGSGRAGGPGSSDDGAAAPGSAQPLLAAAARQAEDAPQSPAVYLVLWTSMAVGAVRGYSYEATTAAGRTAAYKRAFGAQAPGSGSGVSFSATGASTFCASGKGGSFGTAWWESLITVLLPPLAALLGALFIRARGRTRGVMLGCVLMTAGLLLTASAVHHVQVYLGQAVVNSANTILSLAIAMQAIEVAPRTSRGAYLLVQIIGISLGSCIIAVIGYVVAGESLTGWRLVLGMGLLPTLTVLLVMPWLADTPQSFIERGKYAKGWAALRDIRGPFYEDTYAEYMSIVVAAARAPKGFGMYRALFADRHYWPATLVGSLMALVTVQLDPQSRSYVAYDALIYHNVPPQDAVLMTTLSLTGAFALGTLLSMLLVDRVGRLPLLRASAGFSVVLLLFLLCGGAAWAAKTGQRLNMEQGDKVPPSWPYVQLASLAVLSAGNGIAWSSVVWVFIAETQALAVRPAGIGLCLAVSSLSMTVVESELVCALHYFYYIFVLVMAFLALFISLFMLPETARVSLEDINELFSQHFLWRRVMQTQQERQQQQQRQQRRDKHHHHQQHQRQHLGSSGGSNSSSKGWPPPATPASSLAAAAAAAALDPQDSQLLGDSQAAAAAAAASASSAGGGVADGAASFGASPFEQLDVQLTGLGSSDAGSSDTDALLRREPSAVTAAVAAATASAAAAAAAGLQGAPSVALAGGEQVSLLSSMGSSARALSTRGPLWLGGRRRSTALPDAASLGGGGSSGGVGGGSGAADVLGVLAEEIRHDAA